MKRWRVSIWGFGIYVDVNVSVSYIAIPFPRQASPVDNQHYGISDLAREFGITTRAIRFYEEKGMLRPRREGQKRLFNAGDWVRLDLILRGKRIGLTLEESRDIIEMYESGQSNAEQLNLLLTKITERHALLQAQLQDIQHMQTELDDIQQRCEQALKLIT